MKEDFNRVRLRYHGDPTMLDDILQRECRYKTASKLQTTLCNPDFRFPSLAVAEMSTSDAVADVHASMIPAGCTVLDMTCALGIDAFHFAGKATHVTAVELDPVAYATAVHNVKVLGLGNVSVIEGDSIAYLKDTDRKFDIIFADPARRDASGRHFALSDCSPDLIPDIDLILSHCSRLIIKTSPMIDIKSTVRELRRDAMVTVIGTPRECKEVVFTNESATAVSPSPEVTKMDALTIGGTSFSFDPQQTPAQTAYVNPAIGMYLYEPYPAVMKSGGMRFMTDEYKVKKLHPNTHLFVSDESIETFPGEKFEILEVIPFSKQSVKNFAKAHPVINVATRNFPLTAPQLAAKLKIKEGGDKMLFGCTDPSGSKLLLITTMGQPL